MVPKMDRDLFEACFCFLSLGINLGAFRLNFDTLKPSRGAMDGFSSQKSIQRSKMERMGSKKIKLTLPLEPHFGHDFAADSVRRFS